MSDFLDVVSRLEQGSKAYRQSEADRPSFFRSIKSFGSRFKLATRLIREEPEIILFACIQWVIIGLAYFLWAELLQLVPDDVWEAARKDSETGENATWLPSLVLFVISFTIVGLATFPIGICSACIAACHILRHHGETSTIPKCLKLVGPRAVSIWLFQWLDGWITVEQVLDRLPRKNDRRTIADRLASEAAYFAWKVSTAGMILGLVSGKRPMQAVKSSVSFFMHKPVELIALRLGYSTLCWLLGLITYVGGIMVFAAYPELMPEVEGTGPAVQAFYELGGIPLMIALAVVVIILQPIYAIAVSDLYADYLEAVGEQPILKESPSSLFTAVASVSGLAACLTIALVFRDQLGITTILSSVGS
ncbi:MAG: hypothetical protein AAFV69_06735 [Pseudomonadota bacterium]